MPHRGQPRTLYDSAKYKLLNMLGTAIFKWIELLKEVWACDDEIWYERVVLIFRQTDQLQIYLSGIPESLIRSIAPLALQIATDSIEILHSYTRRTFARGFRRDESDFTCLKIIRTILFRCMDMLDLSDVSHDFTQTLCISSMCYFPSITCLRISVKTHTNHSPFIARNIRLLVNLEEFEYVYRCTNAVVRNMCRHCKKIKHIVFTFSKKLNDEGLSHLRRLEGIVTLDLVKTGLSDYGYSMLLQSLPNLINIKWNRQIDHMLQDIPVERTVSKIEFCAPIDSAGLFTHRFPNIRDLSFYDVKSDLSALGTLEHLEKLTIAVVDFIIGNLSAVFEQLGRRITHLKLREIENLKIEEVIQKCVIKTLEIQCCFLLPVQDNLIFNSSLPHYRMMEIMRWEVLLGDYATYISLFKYYINIEDFMAINIPSLTDSQIFEALQGSIAENGFKKLLAFTAEGCNLSVDSARLLVAHCDSLETLGRVGTWGMTLDDRRMFRNYLKEANIAVEVLN